MIESTKKVAGKAYKMTSLEAASKRMWETIKRGKFDSGSESIVSWNPMGMRRRCHATASTGASSSSAFATGGGKDINLSARMQRLHTPGYSLDSPTDSE
jgi:hypothetical protein